METTTQVTPISQKPSHGKMTAVGGIPRIDVKSQVKSVNGTTDAHIVLVGTIPTIIVGKG